MEYNFDNDQDQLLTTPFLDLPELNLLPHDVINAIVDNQEDHVIYNTNDGDII